MPIVAFVVHTGRRVGGLAALAELVGEVLRGVCEDAVIIVVLVEALFLLEGAFAGCLGVPDADGFLVVPITPGVGIAGAVLPRIVIAQERLSGDRAAGLMRNRPPASGSRRAAKILGDSTCG